MFKQADWLLPTLNNDDEEEDPPGEDFETPPPQWRRRQLTSNWRQWQTEHADTLDELYSVYKDVGTRLFGHAFNQFGTYGDFTQYVYSKLQPGA